MHFFRSKFLCVNPLSLHKTYVFNPTPLKFRTAISKFQERVTIEERELHEERHMLLSIADTAALLKC